MVLAPATDYKRWYRRECTVLHKGRLNRRSKIAKTGLSISSNLIHDRRNMLQVGPNTATQAYITLENQAIQGVQIHFR